MSIYQSKIDRKREGERKGERKREREGDRKIKRRRTKELYFLVRKVFDHRFAVCPFVIRKPT